MTKEQLVNELKQLLIEVKKPGADIVAIKRRLDFLATEINMLDRKKEVSILVDDKEVNIDNLSYDEPINYECIEAFLKQYLANSSGNFESRFIRTPSSKVRGKDLYNIRNLNNYDIVKKSEEESMRCGLKIFLDNIKNGNLELVNDYYYGKISRIGINQLEEYLKTGKISSPEFQGFLGSVFRECFDFEKEKIGSTDKFSSLFKMTDFVIRYDYRIYINMPINDDTIGFIKDYQIMCQEQGLDYCMKAFKNSGSKNSQDITILYSTREDINKKLNIIKKLIRKYPNMELGTPSPICVNSNELPNIGICSNGSVRKDYNRNTRTYNDYLNDLCLCSLTDLVSKVVLASPNISDKTKEDVRKFILGERISGISGNLVGVNFKGDELNIIKRYITIMLSNPDRKKEFINNFIDLMYQYHNRFNGFFDDKRRSIPLDSWYISEKKNADFAY